VGRTGYPRNYAQPFKKDKAKERTMKEFTEEVMKKEVEKALQKSGRIGYLFQNETLGVFGGIISSPCTVPGMDIFIPKFVRRYGATNSIFLLTIDLCIRHYSGWIFWNSKKILVESSFIGESSEPVFMEGVERLFKSLDDARFVLKKDQEVHKQIQRLRIEFNPKKKERI
jgi:hypothetical protein